MNLAERLLASPQLTRLHTELRQLQRRFDERTPRERLAIIAVGLVTALSLGDALWISPGMAALQAARQRAQAAQGQRQNAMADLERLQTVASAQGQQLQSELKTWRHKVREGDAALRQHQDTLVGPDAMVQLLDHVLARHGGLRVRAMRSLGRTDLLATTTQATGSTSGVLAAAAASAAQPLTGAAPGGAPTLYRHGVEITLEGSFGDLLSYLRTLESMPQHVLWGGLQLKTVQHPNTQMTLRLYTLSRDRHWMEI
ncbi:hypothetical protein AACH10_03010 [Ideonella sp. DXS22W]|uniref:MSHA biogenesis protein MshJ n=1 Tax=Pseudaquabacterium inlustre TaxID=2984192 RepID=A0ABU9CFW1_9BURK